LKSLEKNPLLSWRVTETDWRHWRMYDDFVAAAERIVMKTSAGHALWNIVEGFDPRYRALTVGTILRDAVRRQIAKEGMRETAIAQPPAPEAQLAPLPTPDVDPSERGHPAPVQRTLLSTLDMAQTIAKKQYSVELRRYQGMLNGLHRTAAARKVSTLILFEGWDAAGKGGAIRRVTAALDARSYRVVPFAAPTDEERAHHYLWRFWRHLGRAGRVTLFDRSWYGRVLVERVQGFATESEWARAYAEINDFEEQLAEHGIVLVKFWIHITKDEQLRRFTERDAIPWKRWKLTEDDWRNREKWDQYERAVDDMLTHTATSIAPWTLIEGNDKRFARIKVLKTVCERLQQSLEKLK
jgi:polyphosphate:AMP phosphotransferase